MLVGPDHTSGLAAAVAAIYRAGETALVRLITRRLATGLDAADWAVRRFGEQVALRRDAQAITERIEQQGTRAVRGAVTVAYRKGRRGVVSEVVGHSPTVSGPLSPAAQALSDALIAELRPAHEAILPQVSAVYRRAVADASASVLAGGRDRRRAAQDAWAALVDRGITNVVTARGRTLTLHSYVEMAVRTAVHRAQIHGLLDELAAAGERLVYVPARLRQCAACAPWESKALALWGPTGMVAERNRRTGATTLVQVAGTVAEARAAGLWHPNCFHGARLFSPGLTTLQPDRAGDPAGYHAEQRQRAIERALRHWRLRQAAALTGDARRAASMRVEAWNAEMVRHVNAHSGLRRAAHREQVGAGHVPPNRRREVTRA